MTPLHFMHRRTRRLIRGWAQTGRVIPPRFPRLWDTRNSGTQLDCVEATLAERRNSYVMIFPVANRFLFRQARILWSLLQGTDVPVVVLSSRQARLADVTLDSVEVIATRPNPRGLPLTLIHAQIGWTRTAYFLTGFDPHEGRRGYFLCELPAKGAYASVEEALEALKPEAVKIAEKQGREVRRQGDLFFIPMTDDFDPEETQTWIKMGGPLREAFLWGTNHLATQVLRDGDRRYARGVVIHEPEDRQKDHKNIRLGKTWHLVVRNTVPVETRTR